MSKMPAIPLTGICFYCGTELSFIDTRPTWDHFVPIKLGGTNAKFNLVLSCIKCNSAKDDKHPAIWLLECPAFGVQNVIEKLVELNIPLDASEARRRNPAQRYVAKPEREVYTGTTSPPEWAQILRRSFPAVRPLPEQTIKSLRYVRRS